MGAKELFDSLKEVMPGLQNIGADLKAEVAHQTQAGAHELAAALFNGSAFVMYPRQSEHDDKQQNVHGGPEITAPDTPQMDTGNEMERGGRGR